MYKTLIIMSKRPLKCMFKLTCKQATLYYLNIKPNIQGLVLFHNLFDAYKETEVKIVFLYLSHFLGGEGVFSAR
jgi:hypothetical protein